MSRLRHQLARSKGAGVTIYLSLQSGLWFAHVSEVDLQRSGLPPFALRAAHALYHGAPEIQPWSHAGCGDTALEAVLRCLSWAMGRCPDAR